MSRIPRVVLVLVAVQAALMVVYLLGRREAPEPKPRPSSTVTRSRVEPWSGPTPPLTFRRLDGTTGSLAELVEEGRADGKTADRPVLVHFWGTWCPPCVEELPRLAGYAEATGQPLIAVAIDDDEETLDAFFDGEVPGWVALPASKGATRAWDVARLPQTVRVGPDGEATARMVGPQPWDHDGHQ